MASSSFCYGFSTILRGLGALKGRECRMYGEGGEEEGKRKEVERKEEVKKKEKGEEEEEGEEDQQEEEEGEEVAEAKGS